jgi:hypothetical protein
VTNIGSCEGRRPTDLAGAAVAWRWKSEGFARERRFGPGGAKRRSRFEKNRVFATRPPPPTHPGVQAVVKIRQKFGQRSCNLGALQARLVEKWVTNRIQALRLSVERRQPRGFCGRAARITPVQRPNHTGRRTASAQWVSRSSRPDHTSSPTKPHRPSNGIGPEFSHRAARITPTRLQTPTNGPRVRAPAPSCRSNHDPPGSGRSSHRGSCPATSPGPSG